MVADSITGRGVMDVKEIYLETLIEQWITREK